MNGGGFNFNPHKPELLYIGSQDYNGALTRDAGKTWEFVNLSRFRFGYVYGSYAADDDLLLVSQKGQTAIGRLVRTKNVDSAFSGGAI